MNPNAVVTFDFSARGGVIVLGPPNPNRSYIKRVIGVAGDIISMNNHRLWLNDEELKERYTKRGYLVAAMNGPYRQMSFVLGNNRGNSADSRICASFSTIKCWVKLRVYFSRDLLSQDDLYSYTLEYHFYNPACPREHIQIQVSYP